MAELLFPEPHLADDVVLLRPWRESDVGSNLLKFADPLIQRFTWPHTTLVRRAGADAHPR